MSQTLPIALELGPAQGLTRYLQAINAAPILSERRRRSSERPPPASFWVKTIRT